MWYHKGRDSGWASDLIQCWFPGYHAHIGGGTVKGLEDESSIDDITLAWMVDQTRDLLTFDQAEIKKFLEKQTHKWGVGNLTDSASYAYMAPVAGGLKARTPGEYRMEVPEAQKWKKTDPKPQYYDTNEFIHPSVRYRMRLMEQKPEPGSLGTAPGWFGSQNPIGKYEPAALKGFVPTLPEDGFYNYQWKKPAQKKGEDDVVIREYKIPPKWSDFYPCEGLERQMVPSEVMEELDKANNYGENGFITGPPAPPQTGFQAPAF
jgi:hypothetical protein